MIVNPSGVEKAHFLIEHGTYTIGTDWSEVQPSAEAENDFLEGHDWPEYGQWYLGLDPGESHDTKAHYHFPFGDFERVHRSGLVAAKQRAAQYDHDEIVAAADDLLELIDERENGNHQ